MQILRVVSSLSICPRFYKLAQGSGNQGGYCEPISFTVPRKSELYQDDLYPDTFSGEASLTSDEWFTEGRDAGPDLVGIIASLLNAQLSPVRSLDD